LEEVSFAKAATLFFCGILLFFLGFAAFSIVYLGLISLIIIVLITVSLSYYSRSWAAGLVIGMLAALTFLLGYLTFECIQVSIDPIRGSSSYPVRIILDDVFYSEGPIIIHNSAETWIFLFLRGILDFGPYGRLPSILSAVFAFGSLGAFSGLVGYIMKQLSPSDYETRPMVFRDYWSQYYGWSKSDKPEFRNLDRKLKFSFQNIFRRKIEPETELVFIPNKENSELEDDSKGSLHSFHSGRLIGNFVDYRDLIGKFEPKLIHSPLFDIKNVLSHIKRIILSPFKKKKPTYEEPNIKMFNKETTKSSSLEKSRMLQWLKIRELFEKALCRIMKSVIVPLLFLGVLMYVGGSLILRFLSSYSSNWIIISTTGVSIIFIILFIWILKYWKESKRLIEKRSDENIFILIAYVVFFIAVWIVIPNIIDNAPEMIYRSLGSIINYSNWVLIPQSWFGYWLSIWTKWFVILSGLLAIGYYSIHREVQAISVYFFDKDANEFKNPESIPFSRESGEVIKWIKPKENPTDKKEEQVNDEKEIESTRFFWVIRYMYYWPVEITVPPHDDWERIEVWIDATNRKIKWVVSDYHYRELWYKPPEDTNLENLKARIAGNFHTPVPLFDPREFSKMSSDDFDFKKISEKWPPADSLEKFVPKSDFRQVVLNFLEIYPWTYMRYLYGTEHKKEGKFAYKQWNSTHIEDEKK
jgi:hypothetical protein